MRAISLPVLRWFIDWQVQKHQRSHKREATKSAPYKRTTPEDHQAMEGAGVEGYRPEDWDPEETRQLDELVNQLGERVYRDGVEVRTALSEHPDIWLPSVTPPRSRCLFRKCFGRLRCHVAHAVLLDRRRARVHVIAVNAVYL